MLANNLILLEKNIKHIKAFLLQIYWGENYREFWA